MADTVWNRLLRVWGTLGHSRRTLWNRPILRNQRCLLLPNHRSTGTVGCVGLRVHRIRNLLLHMYLFSINASTGKANRKKRLQIRGKPRIKKVSLHGLCLECGSLLSMFDVVKEFLWIYPE